MGLPASPLRPRPDAPLIGERPRSSGVRVDVGPGLLKEGRQFACIDHARAPPSDDAKAVEEKPSWECLNAEGVEGIAAIGPEGLLFGSDCPIQEIGSQLR